MTDRYFLRVPPQLAQHAADLVDKNSVIIFLYLIDRKNRFIQCVDC